MNPPGIEMLGPIRISEALQATLGQLAEAVLHGRAVLGGAELEFKVPFAVRCDKVGQSARISIHPEPSVVVKGWPDPDLAWIDIHQDGTGEIVAKGQVMTYKVDILGKQ